MVETKRIIGKWIAVGALSVLAIWAVTAICQPNIVPERWSEPFQRNVPAEGWSFSHRAENWATTHFGPEGFRGMKDLQGLQGPSAIIWGDSFVEAYQVNDADKMDARLNARLRADGDSLTVAAVGHSFWSLADYYFLMPRYEAFVPDCRLHVIHLFTLQDLLPDQDARHRISLFQSQPTFHFEEYGLEDRGTAAKAGPQALKEAIYGARLQFFLKLKKSLLGIAQLEGLRFAPGPAKKREKGVSNDYAVDEKSSGAWRYMLYPKWVKEPPPTEAWTFLLGEMRKQARAPILFVYCPATPSMDDGRIILENPEKEMAAAFSALCEKEGFGFVNLEADFLRNWEANKELPRGFHSSRPGEGHYNAAGHEIVADAIHRWLKEHPHVVYPN